MLHHVLVVSCFDATPCFYTIPWLVVSRFDSTPCFYTTPWLVVSRFDATPCLDYFTIIEVLMYCFYTYLVLLVYQYFYSTWFFLCTVGMNVVVRYWFLKEVFRQKKFTEDVVRWQKINIAGAIIGIMSALGISMVANFQVCYSSLVIPHLGIQKSLKIPKFHTI